MTGSIQFPSMEDIQRLERRMEALEEFVIDEFARIWNCWPATTSSGGRFDYERFESWKCSMRQSLQKKFDESRPSS